MKAPIHDWLLVDWFTKSLLPPISKYVAMFGDITEEQSIHHSQHLDLIYSQFGMLYDLILNAPRPSTNVSHSKLGPHSDGVIGYESFIVVLANWLGSLVKLPFLIIPFLLHLFQIQL